MRRAEANQFSGGIARARTLTLPVWLDPVERKVFLDSSSGRAPALSTGLEQPDWPVRRPAINLVPADEVIEGEFFSYRYYNWFYEPVTAGKWQSVIGGAKNEQNYFEVTLQSTWLTGADNWLNAFCTNSPFASAPTFDVYPPAPTALIFWDRGTGFPIAAEVFTLRLEQIRDGQRTTLNEVTIPPVFLIGSGYNTTLRISCVRSKETAKIIGCYCYSQSRDNAPENQLYKSFFVVADVPQEDVGLFCGIHQYPGNLVNFTQTVAEPFVGAESQDAIFRTLDPKTTILFHDNNSAPPTSGDPVYLGENRNPKALISHLANDDFGEILATREQLRDSAGEGLRRPRLKAMVHPETPINQTVLAPPLSTFPSWASVPRDPIKSLSLNCVPTVDPIFVMPTRSYVATFPQTAEINNEPLLGFPPYSQFRMHDYLPSELTLVPVDAGTDGVFYGQWDNHQSIYNRKHYSFRWEYGTSQDDFSYVRNYDHQNFISQMTTSGRVQAYIMSNSSRGSEISGSALSANWYPTFSVFMSITVLFHVGAVSYCPFPYWTIDARDTLVGGANGWIDNNQVGSRFAVWNEANPCIEFPDFFGLFELPIYHSPVFNASSRINAEESDLPVIGTGQINPEVLKPVPNYLHKVWSRNSDTGLLELGGGSLSVDEFKFHPMDYQLTAEF